MRSTTITFFITFPIFLNSSIKFFLFCNLPAVSIKTRSKLFCLACSIALNATDAGSEPGFDLIIVASILFDHSSNCSIAAALNVSHAENSILLLFSLKFFQVFL